MMSLKVERKKKKKQQGSRSPTLKVVKGVSMVASTAAIKPG
jgi:hypothetical protein